MELRHLRYFIAAAEEEHFGRASERLFVTRPAVSQLIADLEDELGTPLFERLAHRVKLTAAGRALLPRLKAIMNDLDDALIMTKRVGQGKTGSLNIGYGSLTLLHSLFRAAIKRFRETYPDVALSLFQMSTNEHPRALAEGRIHAGFMHFGPGRELLGMRPDDNDADRDQTVFDWVPIQQGGLGVAVPKEHPIARRKSVTIADLAHERFVVVPRSTSSPGYGPLYALCKKAGFEPNIVQEVGTVTTQLDLVSVDMGIGVITTGRNFTYPPSLCVVPLEGVDYPTSFIFGWIKGRKEPTVDRMIEIITSLSD